MFSESCVSQSVQQVGVKSLPVWLPGPMFLLGDGGRCKGRYGMKGGVW